MTLLEMFAIEKYSSYNYMHFVQAGCNKKTAGDKLVFINFITVDMNNKIVANTEIKYFFA